MKSAKSAKRWRDRSVRQNGLRRKKKSVAYVRLKNERQQSCVKKKSAWRKCVLNRTVWKENELRRRGLKRSMRLSLQRWSAKKSPNPWRRSTRAGLLLYMVPRFPERLLGAT